MIKFCESNINRLGAKSLKWFTIVDKHNLNTCCSTKGKGARVVENGQQSLGLTDKSELLAEEKGKFLHLRDLVHIVWQGRHEVDGYVHANRFPTIFNQKLNEKGVGSNTDAKCARRKCTIS
mmetsp:Transcript_24472/g.39266  ORF Transcript_24472/g.39266 Transcript_24472/m.39266 type:complete len:121 (+) Transcript_24472:79-441(+)